MPIPLDVLLHDNSFHPYYEVDGNLDIGRFTSRTKFKTVLSYAEMIQSDYYYPELSQNKMCGIEEHYFDPDLNEEEKTQNEKGKKLMSPIKTEKSNCLHREFDSSLKGTAIYCLHCGKITRDPKKIIKYLLISQERLEKFKEDILDFYDQKFIELEQNEGNG